MKRFNFQSIVTIMLFVIGLSAFAETKKINVLWVIDNGDSMADQRQLIKDNIGAFLSTLKGMQYRMAVTTTDYISQAGALVQNSKGLTSVTSENDNPSGDFSSLVDAVQLSPTSFWEQGLASAFAAVKNNVDMFQQTNVPLMIIVVSDDDDWSCKANCFGIEPENNATYTPEPVVTYIEYFRSLKKSRGVEVSVFPLVGYIETACIVGHRGTRYLEVQESVGNGIRGAICKDSFAKDLLSVATQIATH